MAKKVTLSDIAAEIGVSNVAVYKALSDKPGVSDKLRLKVKELAKQMEYKSKSSDDLENTSGMNKTGNIGVIIPEQYYGYSVSFYGQLYKKVVKALYKYNYYGILELLTAENEKEKKLPKILKDAKVDGLILFGQMNEDYIDVMVNQNKLPVYFIDTYNPLMNFDTVISDGYYGTYMLTNYLIRQGHINIAFVGNSDATNSIADRFWGYRRALKENHIEYKEVWEIPDRDEKGNSFESIIKEPGDIDAFVCNCDFTAYILIQNLEEAGYKVPQEVSVVGFDNFLPLGMDGNRITSYEVNMDQMADLCVKSLIKKMNGKKYDMGVQVVTGKIIYKDTVATKIAKNT